MYHKCNIIRLSFQTLFLILNYYTLTIGNNLKMVSFIFSEAADIKTGWKSKQWRCIEPPHFQQTDCFNCGVLVCTVILREM